MSLVMVVDDSATDRAHCCQVLAGLGCELMEIGDGEALLRRIKITRPDAIVMDVVMPRLNGFQTCRKLKRDPATRDIPVILLTSKSEESDKAWGKRQGAEHYIVKPGGDGELLAAVKKYVAN